MKISFNSPVVLVFTFIALFALILDSVTNGQSNLMFFSIYRSGWTDPMMYLRCFTHVLGHADLAHFVGNFTLFLLLGPLLEEKYGSIDFLMMIILTAFVTGICNILLFPNVRLLGASGVVFALILASSFTGKTDGKIPLTFLLVAIIYLGEEFYSALFVQDNISQLSHILGGLVGAVFGVILQTNHKHTAKITR